ncbi:unnamed protein product [Brassica napus]|uniref:(rape) hypothetical protein n=1 Tax=Brassica napus TaxID=3708 RepID=A0A816UD81_BRANA|nr:unnamed protein product [Brassica napus]
MVSMLGVRRINQGLCILSVISGIDDDTFDGDLRPPQREVLKRKSAQICKSVVLRMYSVIS